MLKKLLGKFAENRAEDLLKQAGLRIVDRNWHCRQGEIDLIAQDGDVLVFVEVRSRSHDAYGSAADSITPAKQRRIVRAARHYLAKLPVTPACRFDVVTLDQAKEPVWIRSAFDDMG
ncbi:MAG: YraN family protein [Hydrogenophilaceae bacterium]|nr:YraN family protein [Hydrogenophilaceae bacterium]